MWTQHNKAKYSKIIIVLASILFPMLSIAHNNVVVIPLFDDVPPRVYAKIKSDQAPRADYFIYSLTARDLVTGLEWQRNESTFSQTWLQARETCADLELRGFGDWRLPTLIELIGITDFTRASPAISVQAFPNPKTDLDYWSSTIDPMHEDRVRTLDISEEQVVNSDMVSSRYVRCVRAGYTNGSSFVDNNNGTVFDPTFGLMWEQATYPSYVSSLTEANHYCREIFNLGGFSDWRVPTIKELVSLLEFRFGVEEEINSIFLPLLTVATENQKLISTTLDVSTA